MALDNAVDCTGSGRSVSAGAVALVLIIAVWALAFGVLELFAAFGAGETAGARAWTSAGGGR